MFCQGCSPNIGADLRGPGVPLHVDPQMPRGKNQLPLKFCLCSSDSKAGLHGKSRYKGSAQQRPLYWFITDMSEPSLELACIRSSTIECVPAVEASRSNLEHEVQDATADESRTTRTDIRTIAVVPKPIDKPSHRHECAGQPVACLRFQFAFCAALRCNPIPWSRSNGDLTQQPTVFMRTSSPGSHPQTAQPRPGTARGHLPRSLPPRASLLPP